MMRRLKNLWHLMHAWYWVIRCGYPAKDLYVIGVTGTDGKTTTTTLIYEILKAAGFKVGYLTTVNSHGLHTTNPGPEELQPMLAEMKNSGITHVVLEVTSHGLDQNRVVGCNFKIGVLTNITHEHLDYHGTMEKYIAAKLKLFKKVKYAVLPSFQFSVFNSQLNTNVQSVKYDKTAIKNVSPALEGDYNKYNIGAAAAVADILKIDKSLSHKVIRSFSGVEGRRQEVDVGQKFRVIVDFAHTPNALEQVLKSFRSSRGRLIVVFGCTGERDKAKRPMMGQVAVELADEVIITSDDTRSENQDTIYNQIVSGIKYQELSMRKIHKINDRRTAIEEAIKMAKPNDTVLLAGKGHEKSILIGKTEVPWSDVEEAKRAILPAGRQVLHK